MSIMNWGITHNPSRFDRWRKAYQVHQLNTLPEKLNGWSDHIDTKALSDTSPEQIAALVNSLQAQASFHEFSRAAVGTEEEAVAARKRLGELMQQMEQRIENTLNEAPEGLLGSQDVENFYRLLGAYLRWHVFMGDRR